ICFSRSVELHEKVIGVFIEIIYVLLIGVTTLYLSCLIFICWIRKFFEDSFYCFINF
ncbi:TPA: hypothetical protein JLT83_004503, partial [Escherichia coli]|nr:hypothetical protein [Escherichia coli]